MMENQEDRRISELDALRGIAAIAVVFYHYTRFISIPVLSNWMAYGRYGVQLFFIVSGFVIYMTLMRSITIMDFIVSRFSRLYPAYWTSVIVTSTLLTITSVMKNPINVHRFLINLTMFQQWFGVNDIDPVYWTLAVELCFYLLIALLYRFGSISHFYLPGFFFVLMMIFLHYFEPAIAVKVYSVFPIINYGDLFLAGMLFFKLWSNKNDVRCHLLIVFCFISHLLIMGKIEGIAVFIGFIIFYLFIFGLLKILINRTLQFLGTISYSLYLIHQINGKIFYAILSPYLTSHVLKMLIMMMISILLATAITFGIEKPMLHFIRKAYNKQKNRLYKYSAA